MRYRTSHEVAKTLGIRYYNLSYLLRSGIVAPPERNASGDYMWDDHDVERLRQAMEARRKGKRNSMA